MSRFDSKEILQQMSSSISRSVRGQGDDEEKEGEEEDEERRWGRAGAGLLRVLTVKYDGLGISMLLGTFSCPLDVAA